MDKIFLKGMAFFARHGVLPAEQEIGQRFVVDVTLYLDLSPAGGADEVDKTIDYVAVYRKVEEVVCGRSVRLIETLAESIAASILKSFGVPEVSVRVKKPGAPLPGCFESVGVEIFRRAEQCPKE
ncbi:MAG: dihydroneopterin aldolase [Bacillota bacterium]